MRVYCIGVGLACTHMCMASSTPMAYQGRRLAFHGPPQPIVRFLRHMRRDTKLPNPPLSSPSVGMPS